MRWTQIALYIYITLWIFAEIACAIGWFAEKIKEHKKDKNDPTKKNKNNS